MKNALSMIQVGAMSDASSVAYLRPETAQGIFVNFKNVVATGRVKVITHLILNCHCCASSAEINLIGRGHLGSRKSVKPSATK